jgi:hypothetical protein
MKKNGYVRNAITGLAHYVNDTFRDRQKEFLLVANDLKSSHPWLADFIATLESNIVWDEIFSYGPVTLMAHESETAATIIVSYPHQITDEKLQEFGLPRSFSFALENDKFVWVGT